MINFNQINGQRRALHNRKRKEARKEMHALGGYLSEGWKKVKIQVIDKMIKTIQIQKENSMARQLEEQKARDRKALRKTTIGSKVKNVGKLPVGS